MTIAHARLGSLFAAVVLFVGGAWAADDGFVPLFNGKDLDGWVGDSRLWKVEDGVIVGSTHDARIAQNSFLVTESSFSDFVLRFQVKLTNHNSGVQFRSEVLPDFVMAGYQADIAEATYFGMLYEEKKRGFMPYWTAMSEDERAATQRVVKQGEWNHFEVTCNGDHIRIVLNGTTTCDIHDPSGARTGAIGLQLHAGPAMEVRFKDIVILASTENARGGPEEVLLMPDVDLTRSEKLGYRGERFRVPEGFRVEQVAPDNVTRSVINMTFDHLGRPVISVERSGVRILLDEDGDGIYDSHTSVTEELTSAQGIYIIQPGDYLIHSEGPEGTGLYRATDTDGDDKADVIELVLKSDRGIGEHGPHAIRMGPDGHYYVMYGNHSFPDTEIAKGSPSRGLQEDFLLPRYVDPRGHANSIRAPGGTIHRVAPDFGSVHQIVAGFRNAYDMALDISGEIFTFDSDMEWDRGLPWFRPVRVVHSIPGGDYGWRTGSSKKPFYYIDTLPSVDDVGRGSPVGVCFYYHDVYPDRYQGAFFMGDWSRGRIRVIFPERSGATFVGKTVDFVVGEPLNVTDMDIGPDGFLYFSTGGRATHGGLYRVVYEGSQPREEPRDPLAAVLDQPMPRSAWGKDAIRSRKTEMGDSWATSLRHVVADGGRPTRHRLRALEALQIFGPAPDVASLAGLSRDTDPAVRALAVHLLGTHPMNEVGSALEAALQDSDPWVVRRACESLIRTGLEPETSSARLADALLPLLNGSDRTQRYAARLALIRVERDAWSERVLSVQSGEVRHGDLEGLVALIETAESGAHFDRIFERLESLDPSTMGDDVFLDYLRVLELAMLRDQNRDDAPSRQDFSQSVGPRLLKRFPAKDWRVNRELQVMLARLRPKGTIAALLTILPNGPSQEEQIHTAYALRTIPTGWTEQQRQDFVGWFDHAREFSGAASMEGYIGNLWDSMLEILPEAERPAAEARKKRALDERRDAALALMAKLDDGKPGSSDLAQMSFDELSEYLEWDPMAYKRPDLERGELVFRRSRCVDCHVFGSIGRGGGPDLSTVTSRFRRRDILEAIMYPSKVISDQYTGVDVEMKDGEFYSGMVVEEGPFKLTLISSLGERLELRKRKISERNTSQMSIMPEGLMDTMSLGDLVSLIQFLEEGSDL